MLLILKVFLKEDISGGCSADIPLSHIPRVSCGPWEELLGICPSLSHQLFPTLGKVALGAWEMCSEWMGSG